MASSEKSYTIDWKRAIFINDTIDDVLVKRLTPEILLLREESDLPITVGIDSPGGSLASLDMLLALLRGPNQRVKKGEIITVVTNRAYSAAANLLAFGDYAVAMEHAKILYHDVRYSGLQDVTPDKASAAAKDLKEANEKHALKLAGRIVSRMIWNYIGLTSKFEEKCNELSNVVRHLEAQLGPTVRPTAGTLDVISFMVTLYAELSQQSDNLIPQVAERLGNWVRMKQIVADAPTYRQKGSRTPGILDGARHLYEALNPAGKSRGEILPYQEDLKLLHCLTISTLAEPKRISDRDFGATFAEVMHEFAVIQMMNGPAHAKEALRLMLVHQEAFFGREIINDEFFKKTDEEQAAILSPVRPIAQMFWYFCALLCRELFAGDHYLTPADAQLLGLVDEVSGGGHIQSVREVYVQQLEVERKREEEQQRQDRERADDATRETGV